MITRFRCRLVIVCWAVTALVASPGFADGGAKQDAPQPPAAASDSTDRAALEKAFEEKLSGCALVGVFSVDGKNQDAEKPPRPERYEISKVTKLRDDYWTFNARVKYGKTDVTVPITLKVLWAGDTPMISMTNLTIPGLGTFTCRVFFYEDRYAGTWQHGNVGGHMWGKIESNQAAEEPSGDED
jgi:hypothetical protein